MTPGWKTRDGARVAHLRAEKAEKCAEEAERLRGERDDPTPLAEALDLFASHYSGPLTVSAVSSGYSVTDAKGRHVAECAHARTARVLVVAHEAGIAARKAKA